MFTGCKVEPPKPPLVETVAVLLYDNETNDLNAPDVLRRLTQWALKPTAYKPLELETIDKLLNGVGIVDGGQLAIVDPKRLGKDLGVQALLFGYVESFNYVNVGFYVERKVVLNLKMVDVKTGDTLWENTGTGATRRLALNSKDAQKAFAGGLAEQAAEKVFKTPLEDEARLATINALKTLPGFMFNGFAFDNSGPTKVQQGGSKILKGFIKK